MIKKLNLVYKVLFEEGLFNFIKRKRNISFLDSKTVFNIDFHGRKTKILLNRKFGHVDMMIFKNGIYEKDIVEDLKNSLTPEKTFIDIGSNIGQHSLLLSPYAKKVYAFEPIPDVYEQFKKSIALNKFTNISLLNLAIGSKKESTSFNYVPNHAGTSSFVERDNLNQQIITVQIDTLQNTLADIKMDVMKIDVEGYEAVVILGNKEKIVKDQPVIFAEVNPEWITREGSHSIEELLQFFDDHQFTIYSRNQKKILSLTEFTLVGQDNLVITPKSS